MLVEQHDDTLPNYRPILQRPPLPATWNLLAPMEGLEEYGEALISLDQINGDRSWRCQIDPCPKGSVDDCARYTILLPAEIDERLRELKERFEKKLLGNDPAKIGIERGEMTQYIMQLIHYWRDARTLRSEFVRWLHESRIAYRLDPCNRSWGSCACLPISDVLIPSENDKMRVKLAGTEFPERDYLPIV